MGRTYKTTFPRRVVTPQSDNLVDRRDQAYNCILGSLDLRKGALIQNNHIRRFVSGTTLTPLPGYGGCSLCQKLSLYQI